MKSIELTPQLIDAFSHLIATTLGLALQAQAWTALGQYIGQRVQALQLASATAYYHLLQRQMAAVVSHPEWQHLIGWLSVTESYFFRDAGQFSLLQHRILPELIARKQELALQNSPESRSLRIWSAGCANGEEAYSLAIVLHQLLPPDEAWSVTIIGTDMNPAAICKAQQGCYTEWSFRAMPPAQRSRYFQFQAPHWQIRPALQKDVQFQVKNLLDGESDEFESETDQFDLIICRNVFIYLEAQAIAQILQRFHQALLPGAYLLTGHIELQSQDPTAFRIKVFPASRLYQKISPPVATPPVLELLPTPPPPLPPLPPIAVTWEAELQTLLTRKAYAAAISLAQQVISQPEPSLLVYQGLATAHANLGQYDQAIAACQQALALDALAIVPLQQLAQIAQEQGDIAGAKVWLKRIIYLDPGAISAYFELGCLYAEEGHWEKAYRNWQTTLQALNVLSDPEIVAGTPNLTAAALRQAVKQRLQAGGWEVEGPQSISAERR